LRLRGFKEVALLDKNIDIKLITLKDPCTACVIIDGAVKEILQKIKKEYENVNIECIELKNLSEVHKIEGLEVEKFPAVLLNGEQITAGNILSKKQMIAYMNGL